MRQRKRGAAWAIAFAGMGLAVLCLTGAAAAELTGGYAKFAQCPYDSQEASKCIYATVEGGEVVIGSRTVPVVNPVVLKGAYTRPDKSGFSSMLEASDGVTLSKAAQPVPGGLLGIVAPDAATPLVKAVVALMFESGFNKVEATLEPAGPASEIKVNEFNLGGELGAGLRLPVKVHLENPLVGKSCYVGSAASPVVWELTAGTTKPPAPGKPLTGTVGKIGISEGGSVIETKGTKLVDNAWSAPVANGCGGPLSFLVNPLVNRSVGLPSPAGKNVVIANSTLDLASALAVKGKAKEGQ